MPGTSTWKILTFSWLALQHIDRRVFNKEVYETLMKVKLNTNRLRYKLVVLHVLISDT